MSLYCSHCFVPVAVKDSVLDPPVHHVSAEHRVVVGVGVLLPLALGHGLPAVVEHVLWCPDLHRVLGVSARPRMWEDTKSCLWCPRQVPGDWRLSASRCKMAGRVSQSSSVLSCLLCRAWPQEGTLEHYWLQNLKVWLFVEDEHWGWALLGSH